MADRRHFVYRAYDAAGRILYIGCTGNLSQRYTSHRSSSDWFPYAARFELAGPYERPAALAREAAEIRTHRPYFNALPERALLVHRLARREKEIEDRMLADAGWSRERVASAVNAGDHDLFNRLQPISVAAHELALQEVGLRTTIQGRLRYYQQVVRAADAREEVA